MRSGLGTNRLALGPVVLNLHASGIPMESALAEAASAWPAEAPHVPDDPVEVEIREGSRSGAPEVRGRFGEGDWALSFPGFWQAHGRGLRTIHAEIVRGRLHDRAMSLKAFLRFVCAEILARRGGMALHAAAVAFPDGVSVFLARSGGGKTTLIRRFAADRSLGDDFCPICPVGDQLWVLPSPFQGREGTPVTGAAGPLRCIAELVKGESTGWAPVRWQEGVASILKAALLHTNGVEIRRDLLDTAVRMARESRMGRLTFHLREAPWGVLA